MSLYFCHFCCTTIVNRQGSMLISAQLIQKKPFDYRDLIRRCSEKLFWSLQWTSFSFCKKSNDSTRSNVVQLYDKCLVIASCSVKTDASLELLSVLYVGLMVVLKHLKHDDFLASKNVFESLILPHNYAIERRLLGLLDHDKIRMTKSFSVWCFCAAHKNWTWLRCEVYVEALLEIEQGNCTLKKKNGALTAFGLCSRTGAQLQKSLFVFSVLPLHFTNVEQLCFTEECLEQTHSLPITRRPYSARHVFRPIAMFHNQI